MCLLEKWNHLPSQPCSSFYFMEQIIYQRVGTQLKAGHKSDSTFVYFFTLGVATANRMPPSNPIFSLTSTPITSSFTASINLLFAVPTGVQPQHPSTHIFLISPQSGLSGFWHALSLQACRRPKRSSIFTTLLPPALPPWLCHHLWNYRTFLLSTSEPCSCSASLFWTIHYNATIKGSRKNLPLNLKIRWNVFIGFLISSLL